MIVIFAVGSLADYCPLSTNDLCNFMVLIAEKMIYFTNLPKQSLLLVLYLSI